MIRTIASVLLCALCSAEASAADVYLNGTKITGQTDVNFGAAKVRLDGDGNVRIEAPDYQVQEAGAAAKAPPKPTLTNKYFLVTDVVRPGATGYDVQLIVNSQVIKTLSDRVDQDVIELNEHLKPGANTVALRALRQDRLPQSADNKDSFGIIIGSGKAVSGELRIDEVVGEFKVTAADSGEKSKSFSFNAR